MPRISLKIVGSSGQGINSIGEILAKGFKRSGYCVFGYREYPSLIKGGHASYQLDISPEKIESTELFVNIIISLNHHGLELNIPELKEGGLLVHITPDWVFPEKEKKMLEDKKINVVYFPVFDLLKKLGAKPILANVLLTAFAWASCGQSKEELKTLVGEKFAKKKALLDMNIACIEEGFSFYVQWRKGLGIGDLGLGNDPTPNPQSPIPFINLPQPNEAWKQDLLITGSQAMGLGAIHAGVRLYAGYPMTPSSPLLSYIADLQNSTHMVIKQAEDEITAAQMVSGAMFMGTRALTGTSGGGFDLMSETLSMNAIIENPTVFILAQRPGPATGLPTWTGQGDLLMAVNTAHGEFTRCIISVSDSQDAFDLMPVAFNLAEKYQISVIVLTDKQIAEALYTQKPYDQSTATIERHIVNDPAELNALKSSDRYDPQAPDGISKRWLPGTEAATYAGQGDEHSADGTVNESALNAREQIEKRMRKLDALKRELPEPELFGSEDYDVLLVGWGSTKSVILDVLKSQVSDLKSQKIGYLHYSYLWPLKTEKLEALAKKAKKVILIEQNFQGQLGLLIRQECGLHIESKILKYDGRPFFYDELVQLLSEQLNASPKKKTAKTSKKKDVQQDLPLSNEPRS